jgi:predicted RNase H-like nuclease (RuvC/YqgF family)
MDELLKLVITGFISSIMGALAAILVARYSKTKEERDSGLASDYLKLIDMTGDQLEKKLNLIDKLEKRIDELEAENKELTPLRAERDEKIESMQAHIAALDAQIKKDLIETKELHEKYQKLKNFTESLIAALQKKGIDLPELNGGIPDSIQAWKWEKRP